MFCLYSISLNTRLYDAFCSAVKDPIASGEPTLYKPWNHSAGKHLARTSQKLSFPHIKASCAKPSPLPMMLSLLGIVWFRPLRCTATMCTVILSSWLSSSCRSSFVFVTKCDKTFLSLCIRLDLIWSERMYKFFLTAVSFDASTHFHCTQHNVWFIKSCACL